MHGFPGECDYCPRPGVPVVAMCVHEHRVEGWVCEKRHAQKLAEGRINCRPCYYGVPPQHRHVCPLREVTA